jgi:hypothetical protein
MRETLQLLNEMQADGVINDYAIGGAIAATFYLEPSATFDLDIFIALPPSPDTALMSLSPIYEYLTARGGKVENEYIVLGKWPVQFLPTANPLELEALREATTIDYEGTPTRVMKPEHLLAIALRTGRTKDRYRIVQFMSERAVDSNKLNDVLSRHGLLSKWQDFEKRFLHD